MLFVYALKLVNCMHLSMDKYESKCLFMSNTQQKGSEYFMAHRLTFFKKSLKKLYLESLTHDICT